MPTFLNNWGKNWEKLEFLLKTSLGLLGISYFDVLQKRITAHGYYTFLQNVCNAFFILT